MEHLWSRAGAISGNGWQTRSAQERLKHADPQPVATDCNRFGAHGKEGVNGSSPSEGFGGNACKTGVLVARLEDGLSSAGTRGHSLVFPHPDASARRSGLSKPIQARLTPSVPKRLARIGGRGRAFADVLAANERYRAPLADYC
jgi:hypothetical protein